jgi:hypothetical protein
MTMSEIMSAETCDHLDGKQLVDGERLGVTWPDGTAEDVYVKIYSGAEGEGSRMTLVHRAFVVREHNGTKKLVRLAGVQAVRRLGP